MGAQEHVWLWTHLGEPQKGAASLLPCRSPSDHFKRAPSCVCYVPTCGRRSRGSVVEGFKSHPLTAALLVVSPNPFHLKLTFCHSFLLMADQSASRFNVKEKKMWKREVKYLIVPLTELYSNCKVNKTIQDTFLFIFSWTQTQWAKSLAPGASLNF